MTIFWASGVNGDWSNAADWSPNQVPTSGDLAFINAAGSYVVTISTADVAGLLDIADAGAELLENAGSLTTNTLGIEAGLVVLNRANSISAVNLSGGELVLGAAGALGSATVGFQGPGGAELLSTVTQTLANSININTTAIATTIAAAHGTSLTLTGAIGFSDSDDLRIGTPAQDGVLIWSAASAVNPLHVDVHLRNGTLRAGNSTLSDVLSVAAGGTFIDSGATLDIAGLPMSILFLSGAGTITNSGAAAALTLISGVHFSGTFSGPMTLALGNNGFATFSGASTLSGAITLGSGSTLTLANTGTNVFNGALTGSGALTIQGPGETILNANGSYTGATTINAGTLALGNGGALGSSSVTMNGGELLATGSETVGNNITLPAAVSATIAAAHGTTLVATGQWTLGGDYGNTLNIGAPGQDGTVVAQLAGTNINNGVPAIHVGAGTLKAGTVALPAMLGLASGTTIDAGAVLDLGGFSTSIAGLQGAGTLTNSGALATLSLSAGFFQGGANFSGAITGALSLDVTSDAVMSGNVNIAGSTTIETAVTLVDAGAFNLSGAVSGMGTIRIGAGKTLQAGASVSSGSTISFSGGGNLVLSDAPQCAATLLGLDSTDRLDLTQFGAITSLTFAANGIGTGGTLTVADGSLLAHIALIGSYSPSGFHSASDGHGGTQIFLAPPVADFNGDNMSDLLFQNTDGTPAIWEMSSTTPTSQVALSNPSSFWHLVGTGDVNGDGKSDLVWQAADGTPAIWEMNGTAPTNQVALSNPGSFWHLIGTGDVNADGMSDLVWQANDGTPAIWLMNGTAPTSQVALFNPSPSWHLVGTGDVNGDGMSDLLFQNTDGTPAIWEMNGTTPINKVALSNPGPSWHLIGSGDFNGDGMSDLLWQNDNGTPAIWLMNGTTATSQVALFNPGPSWHVISAEDLNGDGKSDIVFQNDNGQPGVWLMNGTTPTLQTGLFDPGSSWHIVPGL